MKRISIVFWALVMVSSLSCGSSEEQSPELAEPIETDEVEVAAAADMATDVDVGDIELIKAVYEKFVFSLDSEGDDHPGKYFTARALNKLQDDYGFDCGDGPCYAYYALRTEAQDSKPGSDGESRIDSVKPDVDGWYAVSYTDMGWPGRTRVRIVGGKIDDYVRPVE